MKTVRLSRDPLFAFCGWISASGDSLEALGGGIGHAVEVTGDAVSRGANSTEDEIEKLSN